MLASGTDVPPKDSRVSMELPLFALRAGDRRVRRYGSGGFQVEIIPSVLGAATQRDKDILLFCVSQLTVLLNRGQELATRTVRASAATILQFCNRGSGGAAYRRLEAALLRLQGTTIRTNWITGGRQIVRGFGLIESFVMLHRVDAGYSDAMIEVTISEWLYNAVAATEVLTLNPKYFWIRSDLERRLYELARKHCGRQPSWKIGLNLLREKTGSRASPKEFNRLINQAVKSDELPDYAMRMRGGAALEFVWRADRRCG
jgi:plasmid replication initiation protein